MSTAQARRHARAAAEVRARVAERAEAFDNAPRRAPRHGHTADCPNRLDGWMRRCPWCIADAEVRRVELERQQRQADATPATQEPELRACPTCYSPTTDPEGHCP